MHFKGSMSTLRRRAESLLNAGAGSFAIPHKSVLTDASLATDRRTHSFAAVLQGAGAGVSDRAVQGAGRSTVSPALVGSTAVFIWNSSGKDNSHDGGQGEQKQSFVHY
ncbi:hypothetical protein TYRP_023353 [Tyrophagus putrescentiae]|nr:hypothetical protein TYRP_023353 [Tyrophagus putrescentiae]